MPFAGRGCRAEGSVTMRCGCNCTRWPTTWHLPALHRVARGHGRLVVDQPATQTDQDRGACRAPCPRDYLPAGRGGRHRPDGPRHPRRDPPPSSASAMHMTAIQAETERNRLNRSARCAEKHRRRAGMLRVCGPIRPTSDVLATTDAARGGKRLIRWRSQAILTSEGTPLGECRLTVLVVRQAHRILRSEGNLGWVKFIFLLTP